MDTVKQQYPRTLLHDEHAHRPKPCTKNGRERGRVCKSRRRKAPLPTRSPPTTPQDPRSTSWRILTNLALSPGAWFRSINPVRPDVISAAIVTVLTVLSGSPVLGGSKAGRGSVARVAALTPAATRYGQSLGSPTDGRLIGGMRVDETSYLRILPAYGNGDVRWGVEPLVAMLDRAARSVRRQYSDATLSVGHLSREGGGELDRHRSHESGRDADVGFFVRRASGRQVLETNFVPFRADGTAPTWPGAFFDDAKNWALVSALLEDPEAHVTHIFVASPLRARLLAYAERIGAAEALRLRAAETMHQPRGSLPHDDHFHVRIACPERMQRCVENPVARPSGPVHALAGRTRRGGTASAPATAAPPRRAVPDARAVDISTPDSSEMAQPLLEPSPPPLEVRAGIDDVDG